MSTEDEKLLKEAKKLPWEDRLLHKNWKVRNDANIDLASVCDSITDPKDSRFRDFGPLFRKIVADANAPVQEKALGALLAFLRAADADVGRYDVFFRFFYSVLVVFFGIWMCFYLIMMS
ncbi:Protein MICROTUBULE ORGANIZATION 1 [Ranunculus cassubicifolius]